MMAGSIVRETTAILGGPFGYLCNAFETLSGRCVSEIFIYDSKK